MNYIEMRNHIQEISKSIKAGELTIFCGAGTSKNSGLPLANELKEHILEKLPIGKEDQKFIDKRLDSYYLYIGDPIWKRLYSRQVILI